MLSSKDIADLEKKYLRYVFKKRLKLFIIVIFLLAITLFPLYFMLNNTNIQKKTTEVNKIAKNKISIQQKDKNLSKNEKNEKIKDETNSTKTENIPIPKKNISDMTKKIIEPDLNNTITDNKPGNIEKKLVYHIKPSNRIATNSSLTGRLRLDSYFLNIEKNTIKQKNINIVKNINKNDTILKEKDVKTKIHIEMKDIDSIQYLKNKFQKTHDIVFALMLCENYYSQKNYRESLKWSIIANDIDSQSERSWIWFAKSKYKLNKRGDAIKALKAFLESNESKNIKLLLKDIINGELND